jgi:hypothetical protein
VVREDACADEDDELDDGLDDGLDDALDDGLDDGLRSCSDAAVIRRWSRSVRGIRVVSWSVSGRGS